MKPIPGRVFEMGGKVWVVCKHCHQLVRVDKPIFGSLHFCAEEK